MFICCEDIMGSLISCQGIADLMATDRLFAVFDVRERGEYNECQIPGTTSLPRSQIEFRIQSLVPESHNSYHRL